MRFTGSWLIDGDVVQTSPSYLDCGISFDLIGVMIWRLRPGKHPLVSAIRPDHDMHFKYMCLAKIRAMTSIYHGLRLKFVFYRARGTAHVYCKLRFGARLRGPAPGLGRPTSTDNKADAKGTYAANGV